MSPSSWNIYRATVPCPPRNSLFLSLSRVTVRLFPRVFVAALAGAAIRSLFLTEIKDSSLARLGHPEDLSAWSYARRGPVISTRASVISMRACDITFRNVGASEISWYGDCTTICFCDTRYHNTLDNKVSTYETKNFFHRINVTFNVQTFSQRWFNFPI